MPVVSRYPRFQMYELEASEWILVFSTMLNNKPGGIVTTREFAVFG
jgi:hypothetical protein